MAKQTKKALSIAEQKEILTTLQSRFESNMNRHKGIEWHQIHDRLIKNLDKLWSLQKMEETGGEPDVVAYDIKGDEYTFMDCSSESPKGRRSLCYDRAALESRKEFKPIDSAIDLATAMGIEILTQDQYRELQKIGPFDCKTSSWLFTPPSIRKLGGAIFGDYRFGTVFVYHNGAESYYAARGFRACLMV